jgi:hypothetical protein
MAGRTFTFTHKGETLIVAEGQDDRVEFRIGTSRRAPEKAKGFNAACKEAVVYMLANAGEMKGDYTR